jgi:hypothetical protein
MRVIGNCVDMGAYEFVPNSPPVADAGDDVIAPAEPDGCADVTLDGSGSYDDDGDSLTYYWSWAIDSNSYDTNGMSPTITLPMGDHEIQLIVSDGLDDSEPDYVTVSVTEQDIKAQLRIMPRLLNRKSNGRYITAIVRLPEGIGPDDINQDSELMLAPADVQASRQYVFNCDNDKTDGSVILAFFDRQLVLDAIDQNGKVGFTLSGQLTSGATFKGEDCIWIFKPPQIKKSNPPGRQRRRRTSGRG